MSVSDSINAKARSYLEQGRVTALSVTKDSGDFEVAGSDDKPYRVHFAGEWTCTCISRVLICSHVFACQIITRFSPSQVLFSSHSDLVDFLNS